MLYARCASPKSQDMMNYYLGNELMNPILRYCDIFMFKGVLW